jgi:hypothetical protein
MHPGVVFSGERYQRLKIVKGTSTDIASLKDHNHARGHSVAYRFFQFIRYHTAERIGRKIQHVRFPETKVPNCARDGTMALAIQEYPYWRRSEKSLLFDLPTDTL